MKIGFIGCGNMARAMIGGIIRNGLVRPEEIMASARTEETLRRVSAELGIRTTRDNHEAANFADVLILALMPEVTLPVAEEIAEDLREDTIVVSIAAGKSIESLSEKLGAGRKIVRAMPNTPVLVGEGMCALCSADSVTEEDMAAVMRIFTCFGRAEVVPERLMNCVTSVSGSSPEYIVMIIEAMADAAVHQGMPRQQAYTFCAQTVFGSAKMVLETGLHIGELRDMLMAPSGTTIEGLRVLEDAGVRGAVMEALIAAAERAAEL